MNAGFIKFNDIDMAWPKVSDLLHMGATKNPGSLTVAHLFGMCRSGHALLMIVSDGDEIKAASVWQFANWRGETVFECLVLGGNDLDQWLSLSIEKARDMAKQGKATKIIANARPGWGRKIKGVKPIYTAFEMEL